MTESLSSLIQKYDVPGPRYTSFPAMPFWQGPPSQTEWINQIKNSYDPVQGIDLYVHIPYCHSLCYYCGCSRIVTKNHDVEEKLIDTISHEFDLYLEALGFSPKIGSIHFGGGTPTFLAPKNLNKLMAVLTQNKTENFIGSIEVDPRNCLDEHIEVFKSNNFKRVSLGIQDFNPEVQRAINRKQSPELVLNLVEQLRKSGTESLNFDLIYGLPKQSLKSIYETFSIVSDLGPDLVAFYSYAHLPEKINNQRLIKKEDLPSASLKQKLYQFGKKILLENNYLEIGMDHFSKADGLLAKAQKERRLWRNFMGYVDKKSSVLIGLGPTSISDSSLGLIQNAKEFKTYQEKINSKSFAIEKGHTYSYSDKIIANIIQELMCNHQITLKNISAIPAWHEIVNELAVLQEDGLINISGLEINITETGKNFVRNISMPFDFYLRDIKTKNNFSRTV